MICEICDTIFKHTESHHIHSICLGGNNVKSNKADLCPNCHSLVHHGDLILEGRFSTTNGNKLVFRKRYDESITGSIDPPCYIYGDDILLL